MKKSDNISPMNHPRSTRSTSGPTSPSNNIFPNNLRVTAQQQQQQQQQQNISNNSTNSRTSRATTSATTTSYSSSSKLVETKVRKGEFSELIHKSVSKSEDRKRM
jgi:hypothetical protein